MNSQPQTHLPALGDVDEPDQFLRRYLHTEVPTNLQKLKLKIAIHFIAFKEIKSSRTMYTSSRVTAPSPDTSARSKSSVSVLYSRLLFMCEAMTDTIPVILDSRDQKYGKPLCNHIQGALTLISTAYNRNVEYLITVTSIKSIEIKISNNVQKQEKTFRNVQFKI